ncbi:DNA mismatch endonuclease Vsr [Xinfangfangia sp. D13-10-4-6]|uniref:very short patch repair endonuclease n=1 Tax=Pseudogemmobacter hezensis TaxID=2737662 RepID=UPI001557C3B1|nr:very short patch repair endonuclease [Pseudogemmobacter hezensis]NPD14623.1 DNA mismatch endonuclease Vsr [Pseudogemmobacter hezensis]
MADIHSPAARRRNMQAIRAADTKPEMTLRKGLFALGFRYRLQVRALPGRPDLVLPKYRVAIFANGCFWHLHGCDLFRWPATRQEFWREKLGGNQARDLRNQAALRDQGWRVAVVWECALKGRGRLAEGEVIRQLAAWILGGGQHFEIGSQASFRASFQASAVSGDLTASASPSSSSTV